MLIDGEVIAKVVLFDTTSSDLFEQRSIVQAEFPNYNWEDLGDLIVLPGLVDINVCFNSDHTDCEEWEGYEAGTLAAVSGGVTTVVETPTLVPGSMDSTEAFATKLQGLRTVPLYCDVGFLALATPSNLNQLEAMSQQGALGFKVYLVPPARDIEVFTEHPLTQLFTLAANVSKPCFFHPELMNDRFLYMSSPFRSEWLLDRKLKAERDPGIFAAAIPEDTNSSAEHSSASPVSVEGSDLESRLDSLSRQQSRDVKSLVQAELASYNTAGATAFEIKLRPTTQEPEIRPTKLSQSNSARRPPPIATARIQSTNQHQEYQQVLANYAPHWESNAVKGLCRTLAEFPETSVHVSNLSAGSAVWTAAQRQLPNLTCETAAYYLLFSDQDIHPGDTRFKANPPIREAKNQQFLRELLNDDCVDCVSSYHRLVPATYKCLDTGNFQRALAGVSSLGYSLQTLLKVLGEEPRKAAPVAARLLCTQPARIAGLRSKGALAEGKHADIVVLDPSLSSLPVNSRRPELSPFTGLRLPGRVVRTYLRGTLVYEIVKSKATGQLILYS